MNFWCSNRMFISSFVYQKQGGILHLLVINITIVSNNDALHEDQR